MSTLALWLFVTVAVLFVLAIVLVGLAVRSVLRKARTLSRELDELLRELDTSVGSVSTRSPDGPTHGAGGTESRTTYSGYHRRDGSRQEEVDHG